MYRSALRSALRSGALRAAARPTTSRLSSAVPRRFASTSSTPARKSTWRGAVVRWGLALGAVYWYNTSPIFADDVDSPPRVAAADFATEDKLTVDALIEEKRRQIAASKPAPAPAEQEPEHTTVESTAQPVPEPPAPASAATDEKKEGDAPAAAAPGSPEALEQEAGQEGAFNPETGEINWDCPCLGGMAHGPCGEEFKAAFSCFVYSEQEPKGIECIDKFQHMQDCFRKYPEVYGSELQDDEEESEAPAPAASEPAKTIAAETETPAPSATKQPATSTPPANGNGTSQVLRDEKEAIKADVPRPAFDATSANKSKEN